MKTLLSLFLFLCLPLQAIEFDKLQSLYIPDIHLIQGASIEEDVVISCHGYGGDWEIAKLLPDFLPYHVIGFNFPDHGCQVLLKNPYHMSFGTLDELAPLIKIMRECVINGGVERLHLYGFSAGGGAVVNALAVLNDGRYDALPVSEREAILNAVQKGSVILDCPLKSIEEIIAFRGALWSLKVLQEQYERNNLVPIESLYQLQPLSLAVLVHFQMPDAVLSNRDDGIFVERLKQSNQTGKTIFIRGTEGSHYPCLPSLQRGYESLLQVHP